MILIKGGKFNVHNSFDVIHFRRCMRRHMASNKEITRRKNKMRTKATKRNINIINLVSTVILLYILGSFFEVNIHNRLDADPLENPYNVFSLLSQAMENN